MNEMYEEVLISAGKNTKNFALMLVCYGVGVVCLAGGLGMNVLLLLLAIAGGIGGYIFMGKIHMEYEYAYTSGQIDIDVIYNKTKRKRLAEYDSEQLLCLAPKGSTALDNYPKDMPVEDYTSKDETKPYYVAIYKGDKGQVALHLELPEDIVNNMRMKKPRCVFLH